MERYVDPLERYRLYGKIGMNSGEENNNINNNLSYRQTPWPPAIL